MPTKSRLTKAAAAAPAAADDPPVSQVRKRPRVSSSQEEMEAAAADAAAEAGIMSQDTENEGGDGGAAARSAASRKVPEGLLERRLDKAHAEKSEMAIKIAELEKKLAEKDAAPVSPRPATCAQAAAKVEHRLIF